MFICLFPAWEPQIAPPGGPGCFAYAVGGHLGFFLGPFALGVEPAKARLDRALTLISKIEEMAQATLPSHILQPPWCLLSQCAAHALDFDLRVHSPGVITPFAQALTDAVVRCAARILGRAELDGTARNQLLLRLVSEISSRFLGTRSLA